MDIIGVWCSLWETTTLNNILVAYTEVDTIGESIYGHIIFSQPAKRFWFMQNKLIGSLIMRDGTNGPSRCCTNLPGMEKNQFFKLKSYTSIRCDLVHDDIDFGVSRIFYQ